MVAALAMLVAGALHGQERSADPGEALFNGSGETGGSVVLGAEHRVPAIRFACRTCHGRDGMGGKEGSAPAIVWGELQRAGKRRQPYSEASLAAALGDGIGADNRALGPSMPRYDLPAPLFRSLLAYLQTLSSLSARGIGRNTITFGVAVPQASEAMARDYVAALQRALDDAVGGRPVHGRRLRVVPLTGTPADMAAQAESGVVAVVGLPLSEELDGEAFTARGTPVLFPLFPLSGSEDASLMRGLMPDAGDVMRALADRAARDGAKRLAIIDDAQCGEGSAAKAQMAAARKIEGMVSVSLSAEAFLNGDTRNTDALLLLCDDFGRASRIVAAMPPEMVLYGLASQPTRLVVTAAGRKRITVLAVEQAMLVDVVLRTRTSATHAHATIAAAILARAVRAAGRKLSRYSLVAAIDEVAIKEFQLDYAADPLNGTARAVLIDIGIDQRGP